MPDRSAPSRPRLNWFSPLPPARTAIGDYALRILPALVRHADVVVWTDQPEWPAGIEAYARVRRWDGGSWAALNAADATIYHIGNNAQFHGWIWEVARRHPGIVVLHDTRLHELFAGHLREACHDDRAYLEAVWRCHGDAAIEVESLLRGETTADALAEALPLTELALERARGAVVHTTNAWESVAKLARCAVLQLDLPYDPGPPPPPRTWTGVLRVVLFGYLGANRRIDALLEAIASFADRQRLQLDILGPLQEPETIAAQIRALALTDIVRLRGYVPESELDETLDRAHLAVNLRYPTMGEASDSQLRIWSRGVASLVSRTGWYASLPPETVGFVAPGDETEDLQGYFRAALADPGWLQRMGEAGRRHLEARHDPALYARELIAGIDRMTQTPVSILGEGVAAVSRVMAAGAFNASTKAVLARRAAEELCRWTSGR